MSQRNFNNTSTVGTLTGPLAASATSLATTAFTGTPTAPFTVTIDRNTPAEEVCLVTAIAGSTLTAVRGYDGTAAQAHSAGATIEHTAGAIEYTEANAHVNSTTGAHGVTGNLVGDQGAQTIYDKTLVSPVGQADSVKGDAFVAYVPPSASTKNLYSGKGTDGLTKFTVDASGNVTGAGVSLTSLNTTVSGHTTTIAGHTTSIANNATAITTANTNITNLTTTVNGKAATTYVNSQDTATLNSAKAYTDASFTDGGWKTLTLSASFTSGGLGAKYRVKNGICYFSFDLTRATPWAANSIPFTFPVGARPIISHYFHTVLQGSAIQTSTVNTSGQILIPAGNANDDIYISGSFLID